MYMKSMLYKSSLLIPVVFLVITLSCNTQVQDYVFPQARSGIFPTSSADFPLFGTDLDEDQRGQAVILNQPKVSLPANLIAHQTIDINLDGDEVDEQIIIVKQRDDPEDLVRIVVVDYDMVRNSYFISWVGSTRSTNLRALTVYADDVTGNQLPEILVFGLNSRGEQTLDIFQWNTQSSVYGIQYQSILSVQSDVGIEVINQRFPNQSKPVVVINRDLGSENVLDTIRTTYMWRGVENRFVLSDSVSVSGASIAQSQLADLYGASETVFMNFLRGPWYLDEPGADPQDPRNLKLLFIAPEQNGIALYRPGRLLSFYWVSLTKAVYGGRVRIDMRNEIIPSIQAVGTITLQTLDSLGLNITSSDSWSFLPNDWNGLYRRLPAASQDQLVQQRNQQIHLNSQQLSGLYQAADGSEIFFSNPHLTLRTQGMEENGGFAVFRYQDEDILQITFLNPNGTISRSMDFLLQYEEEEQEDSIKRTITLEPIALLTSGFTPLGGGRLQFEQRQVIQ